MGIFGAMCAVRVDLLSRLLFFFVPSRSGAVDVLRRAGLESFDEAEVDKALARRR